MKPFDEILKEKRQAKGLTQEQLAAETGYTRRQVANWELGKSLPHILAAAALADAFGCTIDELLDRRVER